MAEEDIGKKRLADATEKLRKEEEEFAFARSEEGKQVRELERQTSKLTDARRKIADDEEKRQQQWSDLTKQLKDDLFAPFKSMLSAIPAPLRTIGKMFGFGLKKMFGRGGGKSEDEKQTALLEDISKFLRPQDASKANEAALERGEGGGDDSTVINNKTIKKGGFLRGLLAGILGKGLLGGGFLAALGAMFVTAAAALLKGVGVVFAGLKALGVMALPAAIIIYGLYSAIQVVKDWVSGYKADGLSGAIGKALGGSGEGWKNAFKQGSKWAGVGAMTGFLVGGPVGALVGGIAGMALGALFGYIGGDKITSWLKGAGKTASDAWIQLKAWASNLVDNVAKFFYDPQIVIDESGQELSRGPIKMFGVELGPLWENITQRVTDSWNGLKGWVNGIVQSVANFIWTPGEAFISPEGELIKEPGKLFGIQLPALDDISMLVADRWQSLMNWISEKVNDVATFIWDGENDKLFGFQIPEITLPEFSMPDFGAIIQGIQRKLTGGIADMLAKIPMYETVLPDPTVAWVNANKSVQESGISSPKRARRSLSASSQSLFDAQVAAESKVGLDAFGGAGFAQTVTQAMAPGAKLEVLEDTPFSWMNMTVGEAIIKGAAKVKSAFSGDATPIDAGMIGGNPHAGMAAIVSSQISQGTPGRGDYSNIVDASNNTSIRTDNSRRSSIFVRQKPPATSYDPHKTATYARFRGRFGGQ